MVEVRGRASVSALNDSGHNRTKGIVEKEGGNTKGRIEGQDRGRLGQTMAVERMHGMEKMDTEGNSKKGKLEILKENGLGWG